MTKNRKHTLTAAVFVAFVLPLYAAGANAMLVDFEPVVGTISGTDVSITPFEVTAGGSPSGIFRGLLTDLESPAPFTSLALAVVDEDEPNVALAFLDGSGVLDFTLDPGNYLALVGGVAGGDLNIGTFGLEISNVPIPAAAWLFMSSLVGLGLVGRRRGAKVPSQAAHQEFR